MRRIGVDPDEMLASADFAHLERERGEREKRIAFVFEYSNE